MKVFLDTNIFLEYFQCRQQSQSVSQIFKAIEDGRIKAIVNDTRIDIISPLDFTQKYTV